MAPQSGNDMNDSQADEIYSHRGTSSSGLVHCRHYLVFRRGHRLGLLFYRLANQDSMVRDNYYTEAEAINRAPWAAIRWPRSIGAVFGVTVDELTGEISTEH